ncbi:MAG: energy transducer TonB [Thermoanaerobaculia bacterium]
MNVVARVVTAPAPSRLTRPTGNAPGAQRRLRWAVVAGCFLAAGISGSAGAQLNSTVLTPQRVDTKAWVDRLQSADRAARAGDWKAAGKAAKGVESEILEVAVSGEGLASVLAMAEMLRAVSAAGLGHEREAAWSYGVAQTLFPGYRDLDLSPYSAAAPVLERARYQVETQSPSSGGEAPNPSLPPTVPARRKGGPQPRYPPAKRVACMTGPTAVAVIIGVDGRARHPEIDPGSDPLFSLAILRALAESTWEPARQDGHPVESSLRTTVAFKLPQCGLAVH